MKKKKPSALALLLLIGVFVLQIGTNDLLSNPLSGDFDDHVLASNNANCVVSRAKVSVNSEPWLKCESFGYKAGVDVLDYCPESMLSTTQNSYIDKAVSDVFKLREALPVSDRNIFHLVSHGEPARLLLEGKWRNPLQIARWLRRNYSLQDLDHLNIYGCEFAKGEEGRAAVDYLESALGVSVAASDDVTGLDGDWNLEVGGKGQVMNVEDYQANLQLDNPDWGDNVAGCVPDALLYPGVAVVTCGVVEELALADRYVIAYMSLNDGLTATARDTITNADSVVHHSDWLVSSIGNVFGTAIKQSTAEVFVTASSNYGAGFGFFNNSAAVLNYGSIGGSNEVTNAGHIYRVDPVTGAVTIFATLPQASTTVEHWDCEFNAVEITRPNTGVGLGNIVYDEINDQFFVSNTEDGRIYRLSNTGAILDSYDPLAYDTGTPGIDDLEDVPYGLAVEPGSNRLFFGVVDDPGEIPPVFDGNPPGFALEGDPSIYSIDLTPSGGFSGTINNSVLPAGVPNNYVGTDVFHTTIPTSQPGARSYTNHTIYFISDLAFNPNGELMAGVRVGCHGSWHSSYNHWGETNFLTLNTGTNLYGNPTEYDVSVTGDAGIDDSYGGVATFKPEGGSCQVYYSNSSADIVAEPGPHGVTLWESSLTNNPITPIAVFEYGVLPSDDPKGIGGDVEIFNGCSLSCNIAGDTEVCAGDDLTLTYTPECPDNLFTWAITSGDATISGANDETTVTITAGTGNYTVTLFPAQSAATCTYDVTVDPLPAVTLSDPADVCVDGSDLDFTATPAPAVGTMGVFSTTAGAGLTDNNNGTATLDVSTAGAGTYDVSYSYTDANGCSATQTVSVTINSLPLVTLTDPADVCVDGSNLEFTATPAPAVGTMGVFSTTAGAGLTDNNDGTATLDVSTAGAGTYDVIYSYTDANGCSAMQDVSVTINPSPSAEIATLEGSCMGSTPNDDATVELTAVVDGVEANFSLGATYTGPAFGDASNVDVSGGSGTLTGLMHDTEYTVRVFSTAGNCFTDYTLTSAIIICPTYSLGSTIFEDENNNGLQDAGENGIGLVPVEIYDAATNTLIDIGPDGILGTADDNMGMPYLADASGNYFFQNLTDGIYQVQIPTTAFGVGQPLETINISSTPTDTNDNEEDGDDNGSQSGGAGTVIVSPVITLGEADGEPTGLFESGQGGTADEAEDELGDMTVDFGLFAPVSLGDTTFVDVNENGLQDAGEPELAGVTVTLFDSATGTQVTTDAEGNAIPGTITTNASGFYEFTNLPPGNYYVVFDLSTVPGNEFIQFTNTAGGNEANDSDADPVTGQTENTGDIASGENFPDLDAGVICITAVEAGDGETLCSTATIDLTSIGASLTPDNVAGFGATWTTDGNGTFNDGNAGEFGSATSYTLGSAEIAAGQVTLTLTSDDPMSPPFNSAICGPVADQVTFIILNVDCGSFPWSGDD